MKIRKRIITWGIICLVLIVGIILHKSKVFSLGTNKENEKSITAEAKTSVQVQQVKAMEKDSGPTYKATLEAYDLGIVSGKVSGKVVQILFEDGKYVTQGESLVVLDDQDIQNQLKSAESQLTAQEVSLEKLQTALEAAQRSFDRSKALYDSGSLAKANLEDSETALKNAKTDLEAGKANIQTSLVNIDTLKNNIANTVIKAPISGVISDKNVSVGQMASAGTLLARVNDISSIYAVIQVPQENISSIKVGKKATVMLEDGKNDPFAGSVKSISALADSSSRAFECKIQIGNKDNLLHPGVYAKAQILSDESTEILMIPVKALAGNEGAYYVFTNNDGIAHKTSVTIGETSEDMVEVTSGLKKDESVICTNVNTLHDGNKIEVVLK